MRSEEGINFSSFDVHPSTYYGVLALWLSVPHGSITEYHWAMELGVVFGALFILLAGLSLKLLFGIAGAMATLALTLCTTYLHYFTEARSYSLTLLLSSLLFYAVLKRLKGYWLAVAAAIVFMMPLIHYFNVMAMPFYVLMYVGLSLKDAHEIKQKTV